MDEVRLPFTMQATVTRGGPPPEPIPDPLLPGWVRIPVTIKVILSGAMLDHLLHDGTVPDPDGEAGIAMAAESMQFDFGRAQTGDLNPQEMRAVVEALAPRQDRAPELDQVPDPLPLRTAPAPSASVPVRAGRPGSGLSALYAAQDMVVRHSPPDDAAGSTVADKPPQQGGPDKRPDVQAHASAAQIGPRDEHQDGTKPPEALVSQRGPDALDPGQVQVALQRGLQAADQAPKARPDHRLAEAGPEEDESLFEEMLDPLAPVRIAGFNSAEARLRQIDPKNPNLTYLAPPNWVPSQDAIDRINLEIARIPAAKQPGTAPVRPTWRQSEQDAGVDLGPNHGKQVRDKDHKEADYGTAGSVRPDLFHRTGGRRASKSRTTTSRPTRLDW